jgi:hypothetical protein
MVKLELRRIRQLSDHFQSNFFKQVSNNFLLQNFTLLHHSGKDHITIRIDDELHDAIKGTNHSGLLSIPRTNWPISSAADYY